MLEITRRELFGAAFGTALLSTGDTLSAMLPEKLPPVLIFNRDIECCHRFAAAGAALGANSIGFNGDISQLWFSHLADVVARGNAIMGLSTSGVRFCLELLMGPAMRRAYLASHPRSGHHAIECGASGICVDEAHDHDDWPAAVAHIAMAHAHLRDDVVHKFTDRAGLASGELESWVYLPRHYNIRHAKG